MASRGIAWGLVGAGVVFALIGALLLFPVWETCTTEGAAASEAFCDAARYNVLAALRWWSTASWACAAVLLTLGAFLVGHGSSTDSKD